MTHILRIDASARPAASGNDEGSYSRALANHVISQLQARYPNATTVHRDLAAAPIPHIGDTTIKGYYTPPDAMTDTLRAATALSDKLIGEIETADILVISVPIYNFSVPSAFKAWIDQIVRIGRTFAYEDGQFRGLVAGKKAIVTLSYGAGGYGDGGPLQTYDFMRPYVEMILNFIGISDVTFFSIEATTADPATIAQNETATLQAIDSFIANQEAA